MSDASITKVIQYGTQAERLAFTPDPPLNNNQIVKTLYIWYETDNSPDTYVWDGAVSPPEWVQINRPSVLTILTADPASPDDDTYWVVRDGASPQSIALKVRIAGVTMTLAEITA